jgi:hypothetical protein
MGNLRVRERRAARCRIAVTGLEALLTKKEENEGLTYRLSMRTANLLGHDVEERKSIFRK